MGVSYSLSEMIRTLLIAVCLGLAAAQDTYSCPDGWEKEEDRSGCRCFLIGETEAVKRSTADLVCAGHSGSWVAELDHPGINYWLKSRLLEAIPPGQYAAFWLGGRATGRHSEHQPGTWTWDHMNTTIEWFDWAMVNPTTTITTRCASHSGSIMTHSSQLLEITSGTTWVATWPPTTSAR